MVHAHNFECACKSVDSTLAGTLQQGSIDPTPHQAMSCHTCLLNPNQEKHFTEDESDVMAHHDMTELGSRERA